MKKDNINVDELSEEIGHISLKESRCEPAVDNDLEEKLGGLSISSVPTPKLSTPNDEISVEKVVEGEKVSSQLELNITVPREEKELPETEVNEKKTAQKYSTLDLNITATDDAKITIGEGKDEDEEDDEDPRKDGELCPRGPKRPDHANVRCEPYQVNKFV
jgi:hypothetical protein